MQSAIGSVENSVLRQFGLRENPFGVTPNPRYLYLGQTHREALSSLINGIECRVGFQLLVAQPGMGKTTLLFHFLEKFRDSARTVFLFQPHHEPREFLQSLLFDLGSTAEQTRDSKLYEELSRVLGGIAASRQRLIVVIDEAQNLNDSVLESLRQLSNFETEHTKLMQIILAGQPQLARKLSHPQLEQFRQRISMVAYLKRLSEQDIAAYIGHRLRISGYIGTGLFTSGALLSICRHSRGIPRLINSLCFNALLLASAQHKKQIDESILREVVRDLDLASVLAEMQAETKAAPTTVAAPATPPAEPVQPVTVPAVPAAGAPLSASSEAPAPSVLTKAAEKTLPKITPPPEVAHPYRNSVLALAAAAILGGVLVAAQWPFWRSPAPEQQASLVTPVHAASDNSAVSPNDSDTTPVVQQTDATGNADPTTASSDNGGNQQAMESPGSSSEMLFFDADSAVVTNANGEKLAAISKRLMQDPHAIALIEGHTDNSGVEAYNLDLSTQRAMAVRNLLIHRYNVSPVRVSTIGAGSSAPLTSNLTPSGRASNRRVEIRIVRPQLSTP